MTLHGFYWTQRVVAKKYDVMRTSVPEPLDPLEISRNVHQAYHNRRIASVNDHELRMSIMTHAFPWHHHPDSDETFHCLEGELVVELPEGPIVLKPGEVLTVPKGVRHRTRPGGARSVNLTFEKIGAQTVFG